MMGVEHEGRLEADPWEETLTAWTDARGERTFSMDEVLEGKRSVAPRGYFYARVRSGRGEDVSMSHCPIETA
jgi:hypothetical protein